MQHTPGPRGAWWIAVRPATLTAALSPVAVGTACAIAVGGFRLGPALAALFGALAIQIGANFANDVFDYEKGADTVERQGPPRAVALGLLSPAQMRRGMWVAFGSASLVGVYLAVVAGPLVLLIGLASILAAIAYTGGPFPLGYHGLGDLFVLLFFGFVAVCGTVFVQVGGVPVVAWWAAVPVGALATAILVVNNVRDIETDARAGKRTLAVRLGRKGGVAQYTFLLLIAYLVPLLLVFGEETSIWALLPLVTLPLGITLVAKVASQSGKAMNPLLVATARLHLVFGLLFAIGLALPAAG